MTNQEGNAATAAAQLHQVAIAAAELQKKIDVMVEALMLAEDALSIHPQTKDVIKKIRSALTQWDGIRR